MTIDELRAYVVQTGCNCDGTMCTAGTATKALLAALDVVEAADRYPATGHLAEALYDFRQSLTSKPGGGAER